MLKNVLSNVHFIHISLFEFNEGFVAFHAFEPWCWRSLESPLDCKKIQPVHSEGDQPWDFFGRNDAKAETPILWPPHVKS